MANISTSLLDGASIYYNRIGEFMDAVGKYNLVCGIYNKREQLIYGEYVPPRVLEVFNDTYHGKIEELDETYGKRKSTVNRCKKKVSEALEVLGIPHTEAEIRNMEMLIRSTNAETQFREIIGRYIEALKKEIDKAVAYQKAGIEIEPLAVESPTDLIKYYQATPEERRKIKSSKRVKKVKKAKAKKAKAAKQ